MPNMDSFNPIAVLSDTSLCAIVRDEIINPADGIRDFIESTVPFVEEAVVVDTGSVDGTRQELEKLQAAHRNLRVLDLVFKGYASARNYSLSQARTGYILILDADERLISEDFSRIQEEMNPESLSHRFKFRNVFINPKQDYTSVGGFNDRLFKNLPEMHFQGKCWEGLYFREEPLSGLQVTNLSVEIKHFKASPLAQEQKMNQWYNGVMQSGKQTETSPSHVKGFADWKRYNPRRENYR